MNVRLSASPAWVLKNFSWPAACACTPAELPVQAPTKFETVLNMKSAKVLGLEVPDVVRLRVDEVIE